MKKTITTTILLFMMVLISSCNSDDDTAIIPQQENNPNTEGIGYSKTDVSASTVYDNIIESLNANGDISIVAEVNHSANAQNANLNLDYTRTVYFGNPALGTPIMEENIKADLDLPQRITVYTDTEGKTIAAYNSVDYLINRHLVENASATNMIATALSNIVSSSTGNDIVLNTGNTQVTDGIITVLSDNDFNTTYDNIIANLNALENVSIIAEVDHKANAQSVGMDLNPTKLIIFGNPALGTPLMQESKTTALDLPQKMLIYQNSIGAVNIIYNDPYYIAARHGILNNDDNLLLISDALQEISESGAATN
ncbi:DUF302 domain-containing protein [Lacinutrix chionoecetis]